VLRAVRYANEVACHTIGFTGYDGGKLKDLVETCVVIHSNHMGRIEDMHVILQHIICYYFMDQE
jgi:D-sedoheptulose 7-phosphate isomerase